MRLTLLTEAHATRRFPTPLVDDANRVGQNPAAVISSLVSTCHSLRRSRRPSRRAGCVLTKTSSKSRFLRTVVFAARRKRRDRPRATRGPRRRRRPSSRSSRSAARENSRCRREEEKRKRDDFFAASFGVGNRDRRVAIRLRGASAGRIFTPRIVHHV